MSKGLGKEQKLVLGIIQELTTVKERIPCNGDKCLLYSSYNGGFRDVLFNKYRRIIVVGRFRERINNVPECVVDLREAYDIFKKSHDPHYQLGWSCQKTFNRAIHSLIKRDYLTPLTYNNVTDGSYDLIEHNRYKEYWQNRQMIKNLRFVILNVLSACSTLKNSDDNSWGHAL